ncbi:MAG TPA: hypothetical protein VN494_11400 [Patescibacteria group bacterium]|nr:hypothetical protein [Patescibacteria group bacterium]
MAVKIPISEARKHLSGLLKALQENPQAVYEITVNDIVFGELSAPKARGQRLGTGNALLQAVEEMDQPDITGAARHSVARSHDVYLHRRKGK